MNSVNSLSNEISYQVMEDVEIEFIHLSLKSYTLVLGFSDQEKRQIEGKKGFTNNEGDTNK